MATNDRPAPEPDRSAEHMEELLDEAEQESFPASDSPAVTPRRESVARPPEKPPGGEK